VEVGEDKSFAAYCDAIVSANSLNDQSSKYEFTQVIQKFETSVSYSSCTEDMDILIVYSFLRLGRLYLGRTETKITVCSNNERIQSSRNCQTRLKGDYFRHMDDRCKGLYHLNECDIHMTRGEHSLALGALREAEYYVQRSRCPIDHKAVEIRLQALTAVTCSYESHCKPIT
jgi:hypothetical protein